MTINSEKQSQLGSVEYPENYVISPADETCPVTTNACIYGGPGWMGGAYCQECRIYQSAQKK